MRPLFLVSGFVVACSILPSCPLSAQPASLAQYLEVLPTRSLGPGNMSGRVTDVAVYEKEPRILYLASASGGVWKSVNNGTTWRPIFERQNTAAIGAVAVNQDDPDDVWVGTGEANARNSVSWGDGVYRSRDGGKTWLHLGLSDSHHIGRIVLHPRNPDIAYVAALGHLWGPNAERGLFRTADGGKTWTHCLALDEHTGCVDVAIDRADPDVLYAAAYQVQRDAFSGGNPAVQTGPRAGLYRSVDGGKRWHRLSTGLPTRPFGRCGIAIAPRHPQLLYAVVQTDKTIANNQGQPPNGKLDLDAGGIFRSTDGGNTWRHVNSLVPRPFYYGQIRVDPGDEDRIYVLGIWLHVSTDGGKTFAARNAAQGTHSDHHALWIDPRDRQHLILGGDGGLNFSYDRGATWERLLNLPLAQFYGIALDLRRPYRIYGGLQDNGTWGGPSATQDEAGVTVADWTKLLGFDGFQCQTDPHDLDTLFAEGQYGWLYRINLRNGVAKEAWPRLTSKEQASNLVPPPSPSVPPFRFGWNTPILLSAHPGRALYLAGNHVFRSPDRGDTWAVISPDLTHGKPGRSPDAGHTITTLAESPLRSGLLYAGSDDGRVHRASLGDKDWIDLSATLPGVAPERCITRIEASRFDEATVYLALDRHRQDDFRPYLFRSLDRGQSWEALTATLPATAPLYVVREDPVQRDLLYAGTEVGLFVSWDAGASWTRQPNLPTVPVYDLVVHPRDRELVIATHGRGLYVMDVAPLQQATPRVRQQPAHLFEIASYHVFRARTIHALGKKYFSGQNPPAGVPIWISLHAVPARPPVVTISDAAGKKMARLRGEARAGLQRVLWSAELEDASGNQQLVPAGMYHATLETGAVAVQRRFQVEVEE